MGIIKCSNRSLKRPMGECPTRVAMSRISELKLFDNNPLGFETQSSNKHCQKALPLFRYPAPQCVEHPPVGLSKDLLENVFFYNFPKGCCTKTDILRSG